jgi:hypothetical protein
MDEPTRRAWSRPELIVLVRGKPEEAVLDACKTELAGGAYENGHRRCMDPACDFCNDSTSS